MKLSVVVPVYNVAEYIEVCLNSLFAQTYSEPFEVLLVDDCGSDNSMVLAQDAIKNRAPEHQRYRILYHNINKGLSAARNTGLKAAEGDYVYFLDSDDMLAADCLDVLMILSEQHKEAEMIVGQFDEFRMGESCRPSGWKQMSGVYTKDVMGAYLDLKIPTIACNKLVKRSFLLQNKLWFEEGLLHEDYLWSFQLAGLLNYVVVADRVTYHYLQRSGSIQHGFDFVRHQLHYARASALQAKFVFDHHLQYDLRIFRYMDKFRRNIVGDVNAQGELEALQKILTLFHEQPYWSFVALIRLGASPKEVMRRLLKPDWK